MPSVVVHNCIIKTEAENYYECNNLPIYTSTESGDTPTKIISAVLRCYAEDVLTPMNLFGIDLDFWADLANKLETTEQLLYCFNGFVKRQKYYVKNIFDYTALIEQEGIEQEEQNDN